MKYGTLENFPQQRRGFGNIRLGNPNPNIGVVIAVGALVGIIAGLITYYLTK